MCQKESLWLPQSTYLVPYTDRAPVPGARDSRLPVPTFGKDGGPSILP